MNIFVEKLARTNGEQKSVSCDEKRTAELTALAIVQNCSFESNEIEMGDVINVQGNLFLVEPDQTVTEIEQDEYAYYKGIDVSERVSSWFEGAFN